MPIKFRCPLCQQFLGISRAQARMIVDCPTCGRSIRVPNLDGSVAPLPKPALDLKDDALANALEQLASIQAAATAESPTASAAPITQAPLQKIEPLPAAAPAPVIVQPSPSDPATETASGTPWIEVDEQLAALAAQTSPPPGPPLAPRSRRDALIAVSTAAVVGPLTWWFSRSSPLPAKEPVVKAPEPAVQNPLPAAPQSNPALTGRMTYVTSDGESRPDAGARILLLPEQRPGSSVLSVEGFRAGANAADFQLAQESMRLYGGAFVVSDSDGNYAVEVASSGMFEMLMISNYQPRRPVRCHRTSSRPWRDTSTALSS